MLRQRLVGLRLLFLFLGVVTSFQSPSPVRHEQRLCATDKDFVNPNPLLETAVDAAPSFKVGKRVKFGLLSEDVDPKSVDRSRSATRRREALRLKASRDLTNIDDAERARRRKVGIFLAFSTAATVTYMVETNAGPLSRFAVLPLFALTGGYLESARTGL